jgi:hypothetical protein
MSTKFRQSFVRLCSGGACRAGSSKDQRASAVLFCKEYAMRPMLHGGNRAGIDGTITTTGYQLHNASQMQERRFLLAENTPTPLTTASIDTTKFVFPE